MTASVEVACFICYGYIQPGEPLSYGYKAKSFREKPDHQTAESYVKAGYLWNSGMFLFKTDLFAEEMDKSAPQIVRAFDEADNIESCFEQIQPLSIDYGIMEKSDRVAVLPFNIDWKIQKRCCWRSSMCRSATILTRTTSFVLMTISKDADSDAGLTTG